MKTILAKLGSSEEEVAENLQFQGITGVQYTITLCPIANYLRRYVGMILCSVDDSFIRLTWDNRIVEMKIPKAIRDFILEFDFGHHPALIDDLPILMTPLCTEFLPDEPLPDQARKSLRLAGVLQRLVMGDNYGKARSCFKSEIEVNIK
ncbi:MAG: hypothetical protein KGL39_00545 [Patescibacteria group bacterium]|nr:hypothetical protein [Patescibacteria group bacterium]